MNQSDIFAALGIEEHNSGVCSAGAWLDAGGETIEVMNPTTGRSMATVTMASTDDYETVVTSSVEAFQRWRALPAPKRG